MSNHQGLMKVCRSCDYCHYDSMKTNRLPEEWKYCPWCGNILNTHVSNCLGCKHHEELYYNKRSEYLMDCHCSRGVHYLDDKANAHLHKSICGYNLGQKSWCFEEE